MTDHISSRVARTTFTPDFLAPANSVENFEVILSNEMLRAADLIWRPMSQMQSFATCEHENSKDGSCQGGPVFFKCIHNAVPFIYVHMYTAYCLQMQCLLFIVERKAKLKLVRRIDCPGQRQYRDKGAVTTAIPAFLAVLRLYIGSAGARTRILAGLLHQLAAKLERERGTVPCW
jgi:hypothetical protein